MNESGTNSDESRPAVAGPVERLLGAGSEALAPCPFCGSAARYDDFAYAHYGLDMPGVECTACDCRNFASTKDDAIRNWNTRHSPWLPIESAPRDGTTVLVSDGKSVDSAYFDYEDWCAPHSSANSLPYAPTHWRPAVEAPNEKLNGTL